MNLGGGATARGEINKRTIKVDESTTVTDKAATVSDVPDSEKYNKKKFYHSYYFITPLVYVVVAISLVVIAVTIPTLIRSPSNNGLDQI